MFWKYIHSTTFLPMATDYLPPGDTYTHNWAQKADKRCEQWKQEKISNNFNLSKQAT